MTYELLQHEFSLYSGKARAYLRYKGLDFTQRPATARVYKQIILPRTGVAMIPVVLTPEGEALQDTTVIIDTLEARHPDRSVYPDTPRQRVAALLAELLGDEWLLLPAMHYRWNFPEQMDFIHGEFGRVAWPNGPAWVRRMIGRKLGQRFAGFVPRLGITESTMAAIEAYWLETLDVLDAHFARHAYLLGERASIGDFGLMGPLYAHLGRDPVPAAIMRERAPNVAAWVARMNTTPDALGDWLADDTVPETLAPLFRRQFAGQFPVLIDAGQRLAEWATDKPTGTRVPRTIGTHDFTIGEATGERDVLTAPLWMWQRPTDAIDALDPSDRASVDAWLDALGGGGVMAQRPARRIARADNRYVLA